MFNAKNRLKYSLWSHLLWAVPLVLGTLWFQFANASIDYVLSTCALVLVAGLTLQRKHVRSLRRQAALDAYAEREIALAKPLLAPARAATPTRRARWSVDSDDQASTKMRLIA